MSSKIGGRRAWRWLGAAILLLWLTACQGEASKATPPPSAAVPVAASTTEVAVFDSSILAPVSTVAPAVEVATAVPIQSPTAAGLPPTPTATIFLLPSATPGATQPPTTPLPTATPDCEDGLLYLEDLTIPDGAIVSPGMVVDKRWRVQNSGSCNWDARYRVRRISGPELGLAADQALFPARSGAQAVIRLLLTAPTEPGAYRSAWQAIDPLGQPFGDPIFVEIIVASSNP